MVQAIFYNGDEPCLPEKILKPSDAYLEKTSSPMLELSVTVISINLPEGHTILEQCRPLYEYSWFIQRIKDYPQFNMEDALEANYEEGFEDGFEDGFENTAVNSIQISFCKKQYKTNL